jgi:hypothetical protein
MDISLQQPFSGGNGARHSGKVSLGKISKNMECLSASMKLETGKEVALRSYKEALAGRARLPVSNTNDAGCWYEPPAVRVVRG